MRFGAQLGAFGKMDTPAQLEKARELGCEGLEVSLPVAALRTDETVYDGLMQQAAALRREFDAAGLEIFSLSPGIVLKHVQTPRVIEAVGEVARVLGARQIRLFFAPHVRWGGPNSVLDEWMAEFDGTRDSRFWIARNAEELRALLDIAAPFDLRFVFELHHGYVVNSASAAMRLLAPHPARSVGIIMDPGNMVFEGNEGWRNSVQIMGEHLAYIHCKNAAFRREEDGRWRHEWASLEHGIADYAELTTALKDIGFGGYLCIEDLRSALSPEERVGKGIAYLKQLIRSDVRTMPI